MDRSPGYQHADKGQQCGHQHHQQADTVHAEGKTDAETVYPGKILEQEEARMELRSVRMYRRQTRSSRR